MEWSRARHISGGIKGLQIHYTIMVENSGSYSGELILNCCLKTHWGDTLPHTHWQWCPHPSWCFTVDNSADIAQPWNVNHITFIATVFVWKILCVIVTVSEDLIPFKLSCGAKLPTDLLHKGDNRSLGSSKVQKSCLQRFSRLFVVFVPLVKNFNTNIEQIIWLVQLTGLTEQTGGTDNT